MRSKFCLQNLGSKNEVFTTDEPRLVGEVRKACFFLVSLSNQKKATQNAKILILEFIRFIYEVKKMSEKIYDSLTQLVGKTPLVRLHGFEKLHGLKAHILAKVEYFNPIGSIKYRIVLRIIEDA